MKQQNKNFVPLVVGILMGTILASSVAQAAEAYLKAMPSRQSFYVDGSQACLEAYNIGGYNYVKLGDLSQLMGFELAYDGSTDSVYIGEVPEKGRGDPVIIPQSEEKLVLKTGDVIRCDDGTDYTITDVSRWDANAFADGPLGDLPSATCDWSRFPEVALPKAEARHFSTSKGDALFIRNLYETQRMQYTLYNILGTEPTAWKNGTLQAQVTLSIPDNLEYAAASFWPWRASELEKLVHSRPLSHYYVEVWDCYLNGVFQHTRYCVVSR